MFKEDGQGKALPNSVFAFVFVQCLFGVTDVSWSLFSEYAQVIKMLGNGRLEAMCFDGVKRLCHIRGKLRKKVQFAASVCLDIG